LRIAWAQGLYDRICLTYFIACGVSRLARYNVTAEAISAGMGKVAFFEGTPIPTSFVLVCVLALATYLGAVGEHLWFGAVHLASRVLHPVCLMYAVSGTLMISRLRIPNSRCSRFGFLNIKEQQIPVLGTQFVDDIRCRTPPWGHANCPGNDL
jgi:phosphatidylserine synthase